MNGKKVEDSANRNLCARSGTPPNGSNWEKPWKTDTCILSVAAFRERRSRTAGALRSALRGNSALRRDKGCRPFPCTPFAAKGIHPALRSGQLALDEAERFAAQSRFQRRCAPMVFGIIRECCSALSESLFVGESAMHGAACPANRDHGYYRPRGQCARHSLGLWMGWREASLRYGLR